MNWLTTLLESDVDRPRDSAARMAGFLLLLTAAATAVMVYARVSADADQPTLLESLHVIADNLAMYVTSGVARLLSGITLITSACFLVGTWIIRERLASRLAPVLFALSGIFTAISGICALILAASASEALGDGIVASSTETMAYLRWLASKIGFAVAGFALIVAARYQWKVGGMLRHISPVSATIGVGMQFIWIDSVTLLHPIVGAAFFVWLIVVGLMLATGSVERHFAALKP